jgi:hypothetical protein
MVIIVCLILSKSVDSQKQPFVGVEFPGICAFYDNEWDAFNERTFVVAANRSWRQVDTATTSIQGVLFNFMHYNLSINADAVI